MTVYYVVLGLVTAAVAILVLSAGSDEHAQKSIAGGYDVSAPKACLGTPPPPPSGPPLPPTAPAQPKVGGPSFDVKQSGEFVNVTNTQGTLHAKLRLDDDAIAGGSHPLHGDVSCVNGKTQPFDGAATPGSKGV